MHSHLFDPKCFYSWSPHTFRPLRPNAITIVISEWDAADTIEFIVGAGSIAYYPANQIVSAPCEFLTLHFFVQSGTEKATIF